ncbi:hypothetical protein QZH41_017547 [Actinostola sp. cb2023]|nr:hypothetical protein QZH41_017547 [Actinostola sp. cb2023]
MDMNIQEQTHCPRCDAFLSNQDYSNSFMLSKENDLSTEGPPVRSTRLQNGFNICSCCVQSEAEMESFSSRFQDPYRRRRRFSSSDSELLSGSFLESARETANTDAIEKFLSVCLQQFESYSRTKNGNEGHNLNVNIKDSSPSFNRNADLSDRPVILTSYTDNSPIVCQYCKREMRSGIQGLQIHQEVCPKYPLPCPNNCNIVELTREKLSSHIMDECSEATESCPYNTIGCSFQGSKVNLSNHLDKTLADHLHLACEVIDDQKIELERQADRLRLQDQAIVQLNDTVVKIKQLFDQQVKHRENQDKTIEKLAEQLKEQKKGCSKLEKEMKSKFTELENTKQHESNNDQLIHYPGLNGYGEQIWRVSNFLKRLSRVRSGRGEDPICSEPFYTSAFGYKVSCWAYLNGRGKELGQSLSIYACIMYGEYDAILKWPIRPQYTFVLLDQNPDVEKRKDVVRVRKVHDFKRDEVRRKGIDRPKRDERAIIVGFDDFVSLEKLENGNYVVEDTLFIRILVDIPEH